MPNTTLQPLPYPALSDPANGPAALQALAQAAESRLVMRFASATARDAAVTAPVEGMVCWVTSDYTLYLYQTGRWNALGSIAGGATAPDATATPDSYPYGLTTKSVFVNATWPQTAGLVTTNRFSPTRTSQTFVGFDGATYSRFGTSNTTWTVWSRSEPDTGWVDATTTGITNSTTNTSAWSGQIRRRDGVVYLYLTFVTKVAIGAGDITNLTVALLPSDYTPAQPNGSLGVGGSGPSFDALATSGGVIQITNTAGAISSGSTITVTGSYCL